MNLIESMQAAMNRDIFIQAYGNRGGKGRLCK